MYWSVFIQLQCVSIQLVSPASGEPIQKHLDAHNALVSIQLVSPASGESGF